MVPNVNRGFSFKALTAYLSHDKDAESAERVGFIVFQNFHGGEAETMDEAAKVMALTVRDAAWLKQNAGIGPGGAKAEGPPVWHLSLSWGRGEQVDRAEMEQAAGRALSYVGIGLPKGYQTVMVEHTDTDHQHLHIVVNLVHPEHGKQANPWRDQPRLQTWARDYEKARGAVLCHDREAKYAAIDRQRARTATQGGFNEASKGGRPKQVRRGEDHQAKPDQFGRDRSTARENPRQRLPYHQWKAQQEAKQQARQADFQRTKAMLDNRYAAMQRAFEAGREQRGAEYARMREDRQASRSAVYEKYQTAMEAIWKPHGEAHDARPDRAAWQRINAHLDNRKLVFENRERSLLGRFLNARALSPRGAGLFAIARLAVNDAERRKLFERDQRRTAAKMAPPREAQPKRTPRPATPEPRRVQAERLKAMRAAELAEYDKQTRAAFASMKSRHQFERTAETAAKAANAAASKAAWSQFNADHPPPPRSTAGKEATGGKGRGSAKTAANTNQDSQANARQQAGPRQAEAQKAAPEQATEAGPAPDKFGRSRTRQPRNRKPKGDSMPTGTENLPAEGLEASGGHWTTPESAEAIQQPPTGQGEAVSAEQAEADRLALKRMLDHIDAENAAAALEAEKDSSRDVSPGRTRGP